MFIVKKQNLCFLRFTLNKIVLKTFETSGSTSQSYKVSIFSESGNETSGSAVLRTTTTVRSKYETMFFFKKGSSLLSRDLNVLATHLNTHT